MGLCGVKQCGNRRAAGEGRGPPGCGGNSWSSNDTHGLRGEQVISNFSGAWKPVAAGVCEIDQNELDVAERPEAGCLREAGQST